MKILLFLDHLQKKTRLLGKNQGQRGAPKSPSKMQFLGRAQNLRRIEDVFLYDVIDLKVLHRYQTVGLVKMQKLGL